MPLMPVLAEMEMNGVCLDTESLKETSKVLTDRMNELEHRIYELAGEPFNIASPKQVGEILFDKLKIVEKAKKTKTGQYVTSEEVLQQLRNKHEIIADILEHRGLKKLEETDWHLYRCITKADQSAYRSYTYLIQPDDYSHRQIVKQRSQPAEYSHSW